MGTELFTSGIGSDLWHFIFGNVDDVYPIDSLIYLNLKNYITMQLKDVGFKHVYYVHRAGDFVQIEMDSKAKIDFEASAYLPVINANGFKREMELMGSCVLEYLPEKFGKYLLKRLNEQNNIAVVFYGTSSLKGIWDYQDLSNLVKAKDSISNTRHNKLVVVSSINASESMPYLFGEESIFKRNRELCPELLEVAAKSGDPYQNMRSLMKGQSSFLFELSRKRIYLIMKEFLLLGQNREFPSFGDQLLEESTEFIYYWYHSVDMRKTYYTLLPENPRGKTSILRSFLWKSDFSYSSSIRWKNLYQAIEDIKQKTGKPLHQSLSELYKDLTPLSMVSESNTGNSELEKLAELVDLMKQKHAFSSKFWDIQTQIDRGRPYLLNPLSEQMSAIFEFVVARTKKAIEEEDMDTYKRCIDFLHFCRRNYWSFDQTHKLNYDAWEHIIELSGQLFDWNKEIASRKVKIEEQIRIRDENRGIVDKLKEFRDADSDWELRHHKDLVINSTNEIKRLQNLNKFAADKILAISSMLYELEDTAVNFQEGSVEKMHEKLEAYRKIQSRVYSETLCKEDLYKEAEEESLLL